jgi:hypothetical protein
MILSGQYAKMPLMQGGILVYLTRMIQTHTGTSLQNELVSKGTRLPSFQWFDSS